MAVAQAHRPQTKAAASHAAPLAANPFTKAAKKKTEVILDTTATLGASTKTLPQVEVPATGWLRHIVLTLTCDGAAGATLLADAPWSLIDSISFTDVNGQPLHTLSGFHLFLANLFGAYTQHADPRKQFGFANDPTKAYDGAGGGLKFTLRIPIEIVARGALGVLANTNGSMEYRMKINLAPAASVFGGTVPAAPNVTIKAVAESYGTPPATDVHGVPNVTEPPAKGCTQNWSENVQPLVVGKNTIRFSRVGNAIRNLVLVARDVNGARSDGVLPDDVQMFFNGNTWHACSLDYFRRRMVELYGYAPADIPAGVICLPYTDDFDGTPGEEVGDYWVQTTGATRWELQGSFKAAGNLTVLTNDVLAAPEDGGAGATLGAQA